MSSDSIYVIGKRAVFEAVESGADLQKIVVAFGSDPALITKLKSVALDKGIPFSIMDKRKFSILEKDLGCQPNSAQGVAALRSRHKVIELQELLQTSANSVEVPIIVMLDGITDPHNLGAIARSAECAGCIGLIMPKKYSAPVTESAIKASAGALEHIQIAYINRVSNAIVECKEAGWNVIGTALEGENIFTAQIEKKPTVVVVGNEGEGLHPRILEECTQLLKIPMLGSIASLNASVATGVALFEVRRQFSM